MTREATPPLPTPTGSRPSAVLRVVNSVVPLVLMGLLLFAAIPRDRLSEATQAKHDRLSEKMRRVSLSQNWAMYAPNPSRGHFYLELFAVDEDGTIRELEENERIDWTTAWVWKRDREDIWLHAIARKIDEVSRNRTWYLRGLCVREARRGHDVRRIEVWRVDRSIRSPDKVAAGKELLGPEKRTKGQDTSCNVAVIRDMLAADRERREGGGE